MLAAEVWGNRVCVRREGLGVRLAFLVSLLPTAFCLFLLFGCKHVEFDRSASQALSLQGNRLLEVQCVVQHSD